MGFLILLAGLILVRLASRLLSRPSSALAFCVKLQLGVSSTRPYPQQE
jgi:hypothetical protein